MPERDIEQQESHDVNPIEADLEEMIRQFSDGDLFKQAQDMVAVAAGLDESDPRYSKGIMKMSMPDGVKIKHFVLPGNVGGPKGQSVHELETTIREDYDSRAEMYADGALVRVGQGEMFYFEPDNKPRLIFSATTACSTVVARRDDGVLAVAHISDSEAGGVEPTLAKLRADGFAMDKVWVTASTGQLQELEASDEMAKTDNDDRKARKQRFSASDYEAQGIPSEQILSYEYARSISPANIEYARRKPPVTTGAETFVAMLPDGTMRLVAGSYQFETIERPGFTSKPKIMDESQAVLGSAILN